eukprot:2153120-Pleurochrysis_carterae.AAC.1
MSRWSMRNLLSTGACSAQRHTAGRSVHCLDVRDTGASRAVYRASSWLPCASLRESPNVKPTDTELPLTLCRPWAQVNNFFIFPGMSYGAMKCEA